LSVFLADFFIVEKFFPSAAPAVCDFLMTILSYDNFMLF